jgi:hypothetical protein
MVKFPISDRVFVFVCYQGGAGGENLCTKISQFDCCEPVQSYLTPQNRTVITNDFFDKTFLKSVGPIDKLLDQARKIVATKDVPEKTCVSPSHWDFDFLVEHFPYSKFIRIIHPDPSELRETCQIKILDGNFCSLTELKGYCLQYVDMRTLAELLTTKSISLNMNIGQIQNILDTCPKKYTNDDLSVFRNIIVDHKQVLNVKYNNFEQQKQAIFNFVKGLA